MRSTKKILPASFYEHPANKVAKKLLGKTIVFGKCNGRIVETEAYHGKNDPASHAASKSSKRNHVMFAEPGTAYVYFTYGNHWMFNVVSEPYGKAGAVLIRAAEPLEGIKIMKRRRKTSDLLNLTSGPAKFTQAFGITKKQNGNDITKGKLHILNSNEKPKIQSSTRIGISKGQSELLRFYIKGNPFISEK